MAYWLEIHCDARLTGQDPTHPLQAACATQNGDNVGGFVTSIRGLSATARKQGWTHLEDGRWICPGCRDKVMSNA